MHDQLNHSMWKLTLAVGNDPVTTHLRHYLPNLDDGLEGRQRKRLEDQGVNMMDSPRASS